MDEGGAWGAHRRLRGKHVIWDGSRRTMDWGKGRFWTLRSMGARVRTYRRKHGHFHLLHHFLLFLHSHHILFHPSTSFLHRLFIFLSNALQLLLRTHSISYLYKTDSLATKWTRACVLQVCLITCVIDKATLLFSSYLWHFIEICCHLNWSVFISSIPVYWHHL
jgi:hypothetical protein